MPESSRRNKGSFQAPTGKAAPPKPSPQWFAAVMVGMLIFGLAWVVTYYLSQGKFPIPDAGTYNLLAGFGFLLVGFGMLTRWR